MFLPSDKIKLEIKNYGICNVSVAPVRAEASDTAEIVTQLLFGDDVEILEKGQPWIKIRFNRDNYEGWMDFKQLAYLTNDEYKKIAEATPVFVKDALLPIKGPRGRQNIMLGSALPNLKGRDMVIGQEIYTLEQEPNQAEFTLLDTAMGYLNTPYLWGGKSIFGIDCSGLTQNCFRVHGVLLPRDASQQVLEGKDIAFEDRQPGDVPFFINAKGNVHHVGILTTKDQILHAAGCVRLDPFDEKGIYREDLETYTHQYHSIKRYI